MSYAHTQRGGLHWIIGALAAGSFTCALLTADAATAVPLVIFGVMLSFVALCFMTLTVSDDEDALSIRFGPIPLFRKRVPYARIRRPRPARSTLWDGWGVHWLPGRGWTWNLWGLDCVEMEVDGKLLRIGTDDPGGLSAFLKERLALTETS